MSLRTDLLIHKKKTIESFTLAKADISNINARLDNLDLMLKSIESRISSLFNDLTTTRAVSDKCNSDLNAQQFVLNDLREKFGSIDSESKTLSTAVSKNAKSIEKIEQKLKSESSGNRKLASSLKSLLKETEKLKKTMITRKDINDLKKSLKPDVTKLKKTTTMKSVGAGKKAAVKTTVKTIESTVKP